MNKFSTVIEKSLLPIANTISSNKYMRAITAGFTALLPVILLGAIAALLSGLDIGTYQTIITGMGIKEKINWVTACTTNMMALYAVVLISKNLAENLECKKHASLVSIITLFIFMLVIPLGVTGKSAAGEVVTIAGAVSTTYFGAPGLFTAMILGLLVPVLYNMFVKHNIMLKLPDSVPPQVANAFSSVIPATCIAILFVLLRCVVSLTSWGTVNDLIYGLLKIPFSAMSASPVTFAILLTLCNLLWFFGIHGGMVAIPFITILYTSPSLENLAALAEGSALPHLLTKSWWFGYCNLGGSGAIIGLAILMCFFAKSQRYRTLGKIGIVPSLVGISEPCIFGVPMMLNVLMFLPLIFTPLISFILSYFLTSIGILPYLNGIEIATGTPVIMSGFLAGGWRVALWQIVLVIIQCFCYLPFFRLIDKQALKEEKNETTAQNQLS